MTNQTTDPRPYYDRALTWVRSLMTGLDPARLGDPTPCSEFDVRALLGHLVCTVERARIMAEGGDPETVPLVAAADDLPAAYAEGAEKALAAWQHDALLDRTVRAPWGEVPGRAAVWAYTNETLVHGWDLAVATGQDEEADPDVVAPVRAEFETQLPAAFRGGPVPFAEVVPSRPDAGPTERLANWSGHARP